ncbi:MAG TPA: tetratricopeptide repeat protein [Burkholderiales bacterium]|nr:tetratricopeptide repeat protein [Burkholderiales bacterium]
MKGRPMLKLKPIVAAIVSAWALGSCASLTSPSSEPSLHVQPLAGMIQDNSHRPEALYQLGRFYHGQLRNAEALHAYERALARNPHLAEAHNAIGVIHASEGRHELAEQKFKEAIAINPRSSHFHNNLGYAYMLRGMYDEAEAAFVEARKLDPENPKLRANVAALEGKKAKSVVANSVVETNASIVQTYPYPVQTPPVAASFEPTIALVEVNPNIYELKSTGVAARAAHNVVPIAEVQEQKPSRVEVSNGNGIRGMARQVAKYLKQNGIAPARLTNKKPYDQQITQIEYRDGYRQAARILNSKLPKTAELVEARGLRQDINLRLVLGNDNRDLALFKEQAPARLALQQ